MSQADSVAIGAFLASQGLVNIGQFTGLALGPGMWATPQGNNLGLDVGGNPALLQVGNWYLNAVTGNDQNDGLTPATALKTHAALVTKWGGSAIVATLTGGVSTLISPIRRIVVNLLTDMPSSDPIRAFVRLPPNTLLAYVGDRTTVASGTFTAVTPLNRATNQAWEVTDATITWASHIGRFIRVPATNMLAVVLKDLGAGVARVSAPNDPGLPANASAPNPAQPPDRLIQSTVTPGTFLAGQAFVIEDTTKIFLEDVNVWSGNIGGVGGTQQTVGFANVDVQATPGNASLPQRMPGGDIPSHTWKGSRVRSIASTGACSFQTFTLVNCSMSGGFSINPGTVAVIRGGASHGNFGLRGGAINQVDFDFVQQGSVTSIQYGYLGLCLCGFYDVGGGAAVNLNLRSAFVRVLLGAAGVTALYGSGNTGVGLAMLAGLRGQFLSTATPTLTGAGGDFSLAGALLASSFDPATGLYSTPTIATTWANWSVATPAGFMGGGAHNLEKDAHLVNA